GAIEEALAARSAEDELIDLFTDGEVKQALEDLPENFRLPVLLADVEGFSYREIAEMLEIPIGTVMSRLHRGRKAMQKALYGFAAERGLTNDEDRRTERRPTVDSGVPVEPDSSGTRTETAPRQPSGTSTAGTRGHG